MTKAKRTPAASPGPAPTDKTRLLHVQTVPGMTEGRMLTDTVAQGVATNACTAIRFITADFSEVSLTDMVASLREQGQDVNRGDLSAAERMLSAQAVALNAIFAEMARRAALNMGEHLSATETYMRLALKAQSQSRATVETLATIKNPPVVFTRQMNVANGPQQVNNGPGQNSTRPRTHAPESDSLPIEQSGGSRELLQNTRASQTPVAAHPRVEAVGAVNGAAQP